VFDPIVAVPEVRNRALERRQIRDATTLRVLSSLLVEWFVYAADAWLAIEQLDERRTSGARERVNQESVIDARMRAAMSRTFAVAAHNAT
jgi:hypothetical protein